MPKFYAIKTLDGSFMPAYSSDKEIANKLKVGEPFEFEVKKKRNYLFHKKFFALLNLAFDNYDTEMSFDEFRLEIIKRSGYYKEVINFKGQKEYYAKSISFAKMDEIEFSELYSKCIDVIVMYVLDSTKEEIINEVINFM